MKVDVCIQTYGKPEQLKCTLSSLLKNSKKWVDKIYIIEEKESPFNDRRCDFVKDMFENVIYHVPNKYINPYSVHNSQVPYECIRHQFGVDNSDKEWLFICHNDVLFQEDVIGGMIKEIEKFKVNNPNKQLVGVSSIGQCHNCPALEICGGGEKWNNWNPSFEDIKSLKLPHIRTRLDNLHPRIPKLVPECRLNEFACMINREISSKEGKPYFGTFSEDSGVDWFRSMHEKGYEFLDYRKGYHHGYWSPKAGGSGYNTQRNRELYFEAEENAKKYFKENFE